MNGFWFLVWNAVTHLTLQLHQDCILVVLSKKVVHRIRTESNGTPAIDLGHMNVVLKWCMCMLGNWNDYYYFQYHCCCVLCCFVFPPFSPLCCLTSFFLPLLKKIFEKICSLGDRTKVQLRPSAVARGGETCRRNVG